MKLRIPVTCLAALAFTRLAVPSAAEAQQAKDSQGIVTVPSRASLIHLGSLDSFDVTQLGREAAKLVKSYLVSGDENSARAAIEMYDRIIPDENFGGEYTALRWVLLLELAPPEEKKRQLADPFIESFHSLLSEKNWGSLLDYIDEKYHLEGKEKTRMDFAASKRRNRFMEDFILFNNPARESWEQSSKMIDMIKLQPGQKVADIGSGPGYFTFKFAKLVGDTGKVFAVETNDDHLAYLDELIEKLKIKNVEPVKPTAEDIGFKDMVDVVYMCSLYHNMYAMFNNEEREAMIASIKKVLKDDGKFVLIDNGPVSGMLPYHGPYIRRELVIEQFKHFGFDLVEEQQFIPQRYCLVFQMRKGARDLDVAKMQIARNSIPAGGIVIEDLKKLPPTPGVAEFADGSPEKIRVLSHRSLVRTLVRGVSPIFSNKGQDAAEIFLKALESMDRGQLEAARATYAKLLGSERVGDEYSAFTWFLDYLLAPEADKPGFIKDDLVRNYFEFFGADNFKRMKTYLKNKYVIGDLKTKLKELGEKQKAEFEKNKPADSPNQPDGKKALPPRIRRSDSPKESGAPVPGSAAAAKSPAEGQARTAAGSPPSPSASAAGTDQTLMIPPPPPRQDDEKKSDKEMDFPLPPYENLPLDIDLNTIGAWWEYLVYSDPRRNEWEQAQKVIDYIGIKEGDSVADVGSGAGFYTFKFAKKAGAAGRVYALDLVEEQLKTLKEAGERAGFKNIETIASRENDAMLPENSIDVAYLCSLYHETYVASMEYVKDSFVASLRKALKPGGRLVIVDNEPYPSRTGAYYGPHIAKELVISQMLHYGFRFKAFAQFIPQRYVLVFEVAK